MALVCRLQFGMKVAKEHHGLEEAGGSGYRTTYGSFGGGAGGAGRSGGGGNGWSASKSSTDNAYYGDDGSPRRWRSVGMLC